MSTEKPSAATSPERPEFDVFDITEEEARQNPNRVMQACSVALQMASSWGRDSGELRNIHWWLLELQAGRIDPVFVLRELKKMFNERQDYN